jgi:hypothetical protein
MSASEIMQQIEELPLKEKEQVFDYLQKTLYTHKPDSDVKYAVDADFEKATDKVFRENDNLFRRLAQ